MLDDIKVWVHVTLTMVLLGIALILALPENTFATGKAFSYMGEIASEGVWSGVFMIGAMFGVMGVHTTSRYLRILSLIVVSSLHGAFALMIGISNPISTGTVSYSAWAVLGYLLTLRYAKDVK